LPEPGLKVLLRELGVVMTMPLRCSSPLSFARLSGELSEEAKPPQPLY